MKAVNVDDVLNILHKYGKYIFVTDEKKYSDMIDEISNLKALEQEPTTKNDLAQERYQDLKEYFGDKETTILEDKKEFKAWLERVKWHVKRADELARELEALKQESVIDKIRAEIEQLPTTTCTETRRTHIDADDFKENVLAILDKYKTENNLPLCEDVIHGDFMGVMDKEQTNETM